MVVLQEPGRAVVVVLVDHVHARRPVQLGQAGRRSGPWRRAGVADDLDVGVLGLDGVRNCCELAKNSSGRFSSLPTPMWSGRTASGGPSASAACAPRSTARPLANSMRSRVSWMWRCSSASSTVALFWPQPVTSAGHHRQRHRADVLGELEVLVVAQAVGLVVAPEVRGSSARCSTGPTVSFHWYERAARVSWAPLAVMLPVFTRQPPGKRTKPGFSAAIFSARSLRRPFCLPSRCPAGTARPCPAGGCRCRRRDREPSGVRGAWAVSVPVYFVHLSPCTVIVAVARRVTAGGLQRHGQGVPAALAVRAHTEKSYFLRASPAPCPAL